MHSDVKKQEPVPGWEAMEFLALSLPNSSYFYPNVVTRPVIRLSVLRLWLLNRIEFWTTGNPFFGHGGPSRSSLHWDTEENPVHSAFLIILWVPVYSHQLFSASLPHSGGTLSNTPPLPCSNGCSLMLCLELLRAFLSVCPYQPYS